MSVSAVVVSHGQADLVAALLPVLRPQVDELVVIANIPGSAPAGVPAVENDRPVGFAANVNRGVAATSGEYVLVCNPDATPEPGAVAELVRFADEHPRAGIVGPQMRNPDGSWQPSRRRFPTVLGTLVRRTPLRYAFRPFDRQRSHYVLDERPTEPVEADWMLGGFLLLRRAGVGELGGVAAGVPPYRGGSDLR